MAEGEAVNIWEFDKNIVSIEIEVARKDAKKVLMVLHLLMEFGVDIVGIIGGGNGENRKKKFK